MKNCNPCENRFPPYIPDGECCDKHHHHHHPDMPPVPSVCEGEDLYEAMNRLSDRVNVCIHTYNEVMHNAYKTLRNLECAAQKVGAYYSPSEVSVEDGYNSDMRATYQVIRVKPFDAHGCPIRVELGLAYNNTTNSGILQSITSKSDMVLADKIAVAIENNRNMGYSWYGSVVYKGAPLPTNKELNNDKWTVGFTKHGTMKVYSNVNSSAEKLIADGIVNAMGCNNILVKNGEKTDMSERDGSTYHASKLSRVAMGQIDSTKEMIFVAVSKENETDRQGMTSEELQTIMHGLGCYVAVQLCEREYAQMLDKGGELIQSPEYEPDADAPAFWYITRKPYYTNDFQDEIGHLTQNYQSVVRKNQANEGQIRNMALSLSNLSSRVETIETNSETWNQHFNEIDSDITKINGEIDALKSKDNELNNDIDTLEASLSSLTERVSTNESDISSLKSKVSEHTQDLSEIHSSLTQDETQISLNKTNIEALQAENKTQGTDISDIKEKNTEQDTDIAALKLKDTSLEGSIDTIQNSITTLNSEVTALNNSIDSVNQTVTSTTTLVNSLSNTVHNLNETVTEHQTTLSSLASKDVELETDITNITNGTTKLPYLPATTEDNENYTVSAESVNISGNSLKLNTVTISDASTSYSTNLISFNNARIMNVGSISVSTPLPLGTGGINQITLINYLSYLNGPYRFSIHLEDPSLTTLIYYNGQFAIYKHGVIPTQQGRITFNFNEEKNLFWDLIKNSFVSDAKSNYIYFVSPFTNANKNSHFFIYIKYDDQQMEFKFSEDPSTLPSGSYLFPLTCTYQDFGSLQFPPFEALN